MSEDEQVSVWPPPIDMTVGLLLQKQSPIYLRLLLPLVFCGLGTIVGSVVGLVALFVFISFDANLSEPPGSIIAMAVAILAGGLAGFIICLTLWLIVGPLRRHIACRWTPSFKRGLAYLRRLVRAR